MMPCVGAQEKFSFESAPQPDIFAGMKPINYAFLVINLTLLATLSAARGEILHLKIPSTALSDSNRVVVATPQDYDPGRRGGYPLILMLHGWSGDETQWEDDSDLQYLCDTYDVLLVLPDGGYDGWWVDSEQLAGRNYDTHIRVELKDWMIQRFNASGRKGKHGIMGLSMGGFGAIGQALKYPREYAAAASLSGVMDITRHTDNWHIHKALGKYEAAPGHWEANNPLHLADKRAPWRSPELLLICGRDDFAFQENQDMAGKLEQKGYKIVFREEEGTHSHDFWKTHVESAIKFIVSEF